MDAGLCLLYWLILNPFIESVTWLHVGQDGSDSFYVTGDRLAAYSPSSEQ